jgi:transcriptional regulator with XRE-family HTH domain
MCYIPIGLRITGRRVVTFARRIGDEERRSRKGLREKLRLARTERKLSQAVVAYMLGCSQSYLSKVERTGRVDFVRLQRLAAIYAKPLDWFQTLGDVFQTDEHLYLGYPLLDWPQLEKTRHSVSATGWRKKIWEAYGSLNEYVRSPEYERLRNGEDFDAIFTEQFLAEKKASRKLSLNKENAPSD